MSDIDPLADDLIPIRELPRLLPPRRGGGRLHAATIWRWIRHGYGPGHIVLPTVRIGGNIYTSRTALRDWCAQLSPSPAAVEAPRTLRRRRQDSDRAAERLTDLGI
jgi:hypothetical protein